MHHRLLVASFYILTCKPAGVASIARSADVRNTARRALNVARATDDAQKQNELSSHGINLEPFEGGHRASNHHQAHNHQIPVSTSLTFTYLLPLGHDPTTAGMAEPTSTSMLNIVTTATASTTTATTTSTSTTATATATATTTATATATATTTTKQTTTTTTAPTTTTTTTTSTTTTTTTAATTTTSTLTTITTATETTTAATTTMTTPLTTAAITTTTTSGIASSTSTTSTTRTTTTTTASATATTTTSKTGTTTIATTTQRTTPTTTTRLRSPSAVRICIEGHLVPSFYLIGAQKAATTNFADLVFAHDALVAQPRLMKLDEIFYYKELTVFNSWRYHELGKGGWLQYWPQCDENYDFTMDATPSYLASDATPSRIASWYGNFANQIIFMVLLREPLDRMRSSFYHLKAAGGLSGQTFPQYAYRSVQNIKVGCATGKKYDDDNDLRHCVNPDEVPWGDPFRLSLYVPQLHSWLSTFPAKNFIIAPWKVFLKPDINAEPLLQYVVKDRMHATLPASNMGPLDEKAYTSKAKEPRDSLKDDLDMLHPKTRAELLEVMESLSGAKTIAKLLLPLMKEGLTVFGYEGGDSESSLAEFIKAHW